MRTSYQWRRRKRLRTTPLHSHKRSWKQIIRKCGRCQTQYGSPFCCCWPGLVGLEMWCKLAVAWKVTVPTEWAGTFPGRSMLPRTILAWSTGSEGGQCAAGRRFWQGKSRRFLLDGAWSFNISIEIEVNSSIQHGNMKHEAISNDA